PCRQPQCPAQQHQTLARGGVDRASVSSSLAIQRPPELTWLPAIQRRRPFQDRSQGLVGGWRRNPPAHARRLAHAACVVAPGTGRTAATGGTFAAYSINSGVMASFPRSTACAAACVTKRTITSSTPPD